MSRGRRHHRGPTLQTLTRWLALTWMTMASPLGRNWAYGLRQVPPGHRSLMVMGSSSKILGRRAPRPRGPGSEFLNPKKYAPRILGSESLGLRLKPDSISPRALGPEALSPQSLGAGFWIHNS